MKLRVLADQEIKFRGERFLVDVVESGWSTFVAEETESDVWCIGYAQLGDALVWRVRRSTDGETWRVLHELHTDVPAGDLARPRIPIRDLRVGDHFEICDGDNTKKWRFCTVLAVEGGEVQVEETKNGIASNKTYKRAKFENDWFFKDLFAAKPTLPPHAVECNICGMAHEFHAPTWSGVRCRECTTLLPNGPSAARV